MEGNYNIDIYNILIKLKKEKQILIFTIIMIPFLILIVSFIIPKKYTSNALILPPEESFDPLMYGFSGIGEGLSSGFSKLLGGNTASELWTSILRSRTVMNSTIDELDLLDRWDLENYTEAQKVLKRVISISISTEGVIELNVTTDNPILSRDIAYELIVNLDRINQDLLHSYASNRRKFIEKRLNQVNDSMFSIENEMLEFTEDKGLINIELEGSAIIEILGTLKAQAMILEAELAGLRTEITPLHPQRRGAEARLSSINERIRQIESEGGNGLGLGFSVPLESLPKYALEYARLKKYYYVQLKIFELLAQEHERAKIAEQKDTPSLKVIDWPEIPEEKSYPKKSIFLIVGIFLGIIGGILLALLKSKIEDDLKKKEIREKWGNIIYKW